MYRYLSLFLRRGLGCAAAFFIAGCGSLSIALAVSQSAPNAGSKSFRAGAATVNIDPTAPESIIAGGFLEGRASQVQDPLLVRAIVLDDGTTALALVVVDTCMMPQSLIDEAKHMAHAACGIPTQHMLVSATHTHSAPAAMGCLGTRQDEAYAAMLPSKISEAIVAAHAKLQPARIGWNAVEDWQHTHNRRWIRHSDKKVIDPFGDATGLANMHPGYQSPDIIGPSGPVDPTLSVIAIQTLEGRPLALYANYSQHYFGATAISADYYGRFCKHMADMLGESGDGNGPFVCALSQGTSGDLMWMDYGSQAVSITLDAYAEAVARYAEKALDGITYDDHAVLGAVEKTLKLHYRVPSESRRKWAEPIAAAIENGIPKSLPEVYAREAMILHDRKSTELKLQALRIGDLSIAALPNEVYALTGLKLRGRSPATQHFNVELANGAEGYIPTPEQHTLGGYTTWPARTAGLEVAAEPKIVDALVEAIEQVTGKPRRTMIDEHGPYAVRVLDDHPIGYWRMNDEDGSSVRNAVPNAPEGILMGGFALFLPGPGSGTGIGTGEHLRSSAFSGPTQINRSIHFAGGSFIANDLPVKDRHTLSYWFWLGERSGASERHGILSFGPSGEMLRVQQFADHTAQLKLETPIAPGQASRSVVSDRKLQADAWNFIAIVRDGAKIDVFVNGTPDAALHFIDAPALNKSMLQCGVQLQGKLDEIAIFDRPLTEVEIRSQYDASQLETNVSQASQAVPTPDANATSPVPARPLGPKESLKAIHVPPGFRVELAASEPLVLDPVAFDWDLNGRLWVVEMADYPLGMDGQGQPGGRIRVLEDQNHDGVYDSSVLFDEGLSFPTGILCYRDGVLVTAAPKLWFLRDSDGDGRADQREVLFEGFNEGNQQLRMNHPRFGLDGWVYCANGGHHPNHGLGIRVHSTRNGKTYDLGSHDFRFQPETGELALESGPSQFGRNRDPWGRWFGTQNASPLWHYVLPDRYLARNPHMAVATAIQHVVPTGSPPVYPASPLEKRFHSFEQSGHFTSACSGMIYGDHLLFGPTKSMHAFSCEPFHNLVQHNVMRASGVSFTSTRPVGEGKVDFFASEDRWCRPVMVRTGPDGALWVADMVRYMIEHPDWLPPEGKDELRPHYRLGDDCGRIYRVVPSIGSPAFAGLDTRSPQAMAAALDSPNDWQRNAVQQWLLWQNDPAAVPELQRIAKSGLHPEARLQSLYVLEGLQSLSHALLTEKLTDRCTEVREGALRLAEAHDDRTVFEAACSLVEDPDPKVILQLAFSLGQWSNPDAGRLLSRIAERYPEDPFMQAAVMSSSLRHASSFAVSILARTPRTLAAYREPLLRQSIAINDHATLSVVMDHAIQVAETRGDAAILDAILLDLQRLGVDIYELSGRATDKGLIDATARLAKWAEAATRRAQDAAGSPASRIAAGIPLSRLSANREQAVSGLAAWLNPTIDPALQLQVIRSLSQSGHARVPEFLAQALPQLTPELSGVAIDAWLSREAWIEDLVTRMERVEIDWKALQPVQLARLREHPLTAIAARFRALESLGGEATREEVLARYLDATHSQGDVARGQKVYERACASCHRRGSSFLGEVGPNLASVVGHTKEKLLRNILIPSADIQPGFHAFTCLLEEGEVIAGVLASETANSIAIKQANGEVRSIPREEIQQLRNSNRSLMPDGLEATIKVEEMRDLIEYLQQPIASP